MSDITIYEEIAADLGRMQASAGGTREQRLATARLLVGLWHHAGVELVRALKREDIEASVREDVSDVTLRVGGAFVKMQRFSCQEAITFEFVGFDRRLLPDAATRQSYEFGWLTVEQAQDLVGRAIADLGRLLRQEVALRMRQTGASA